MNFIFYIQKTSIGVKSTICRKCMWNDEQKYNWLERCVNSPGTEGHFHTKHCYYTRMRNTGQHSLRGQRDLKIKLKRLIRAAVLSASQRHSGIRDSSVPKLDNLDFITPTKHKYTLAFKTVWGRQDIVMFVKEVSSARNCEIFLRFKIAVFCVNIY